jgi:hypothetical protein
MTLPALKAQIKRIRGIGERNRPASKRAVRSCATRVKRYEGARVGRQQGDGGWIEPTSKRANFAPSKGRATLRTRSRDDVGVVDGVTAEGVTSGRRQRFHGYTGSTSCTGRAPVTLGCAGAITGSRSTKHGRHSPPTWVPQPTRSLL